MPTRTLCPVLVGREQELAALEDALRSARSGEGRIVVVAGDAGIGKTRLVGELALRAEADHVPVLRGGFSETDLQVPFLPFIEALRTYGRRNPASPPIPEFDELFGVGSVAGEGTDPTRRRVGIFESVVRSLEGVAADRGAVLVIEDLHWSDSGTRDLLDYLVRSLPGSRLLVVATYRADELSRGHPVLPLVRGWARRDLATLIDLRPLDPAGIEAMLTATIGRGEAGLAARLHRRCEGNPFVLEEILKAGGGDLADLAEPALPATVRDAILQRVERLASPHLEVLRAAAVLGEPIDDGILGDLLGPGVPEALEECARQQLLTALPNGAYAWRHALTREAVYQDIAPARRRRLHGELADVLDGRAGVEDVVVCGHLAGAERWEAAVPRCRRAATAATAIGAFADAAQLLELCRPHVEEGAGRAELLEELAELLMQSGAPQRGEAVAREALALRERHADAVAAAIARRTLALCLWQQARWAEAIALEDRSIAELEAIGPTPTLVGALGRRASWNLLFEAEIPAALALVERARRLAEEHGFEPELYRADEGQVRAMSGRVDEGLAIMDDGWRSRLRPSAGRGSDWREAKFMLHHAVAFRNLLGRTNESLAILVEAPTSPVAQDAADASLAVVRIEALWAHGEVAAARAMVGSLDLSRVEPNVVPWAQSVRADVLLSSGQTAAAAEIAGTAMPPHWQPVSQLRAAGLVRILLAAGDPSGALALARRLDRLGHYGIELRLPFIDAAVEANLAAGEISEAERLAAQAADAHPDDPLRSCVEARMRMAAGADGEVLDRLASAADGFVLTGHRQNEWRARRLLARALRNLGRRREAQAELQRIDDDMAAANGMERSLAGLHRGLVLSPRELEVALLVAQGLRNREIADRLFISERTVENHIHRILERSGLRSRVALAAQVTGLSGELSGSPR